MTEDLRALVDSTGALGPLAFVLLYVVVTVLFVPGTVLSVAAGALFGPVLGTLLTLLGAVGGAVAAFEVARRLGRERLRARLGDRTAAADRWVQRQGLSGVIALRLLPVVPFNALNYAFGLAAVSRRDHLLGTAVGIVPGTVAFVALGSSVGDPGSPAFLGSVAAVLLLVAVSAYRTRRAELADGGDDGPLPGTSAGPAPPTAAPDAPGGP